MVSAGKPIRVGVNGAAGRMGATVCEAIVADPDLELVAAVDPHHVGIDLNQVARVEPCDLEIGAGQEFFVHADAEVVVDFTTADAARDNLLYLAGKGIHAVVGTSGLSDADLAELREAFTSSNCVIAPNFAIGAVLMMRFAEMAAPYFDSAEIIELHHDQKIDAPSGTAMSTIERMAAASDHWSPDPTQREVIEQARGGEGPAGIRVHSVRMRGLVAHQEVLLGTEGQSLTIRHDSYDRTSFMPGVVLAVKKVGSMSGVTVGLDALLDV
jgi:4-hydroxy-tetrahydrodipicolinate reductase